MVAVGLRELKARLSRYVGKARRGEEVVVTERGKEVALIVPISRERRALLRLAERGKAKMPAGKPKGRRGVQVKGRLLSETVLGDRR